MNGPTARLTLAILYGVSIVACWAFDATRAAWGRLRGR